MEFKHNRRYFKQRSYVFPAIGGGIAAAGLIILLIVNIIGGRGMRALNSAGFFLLLAGAGIIAIAVSGWFKDNDIEAQIGRKKSGLIQRAMNHFSLEDKHIKRLPPCEIANYNFRADEFMVQKGMDSKYRSSLYTATAILFGMEKLYIYAYNFSLTEDNESVDAHIIPYDDITSVSLFEGVYNDEQAKKPFSVKHYGFELTAAGDVSVSLPAANDADLDKLIDNIKSYSPAGRSR